MKNGVKVALTVITGVVVFFLSTRFIFVIPSYGGHKAFITYLVGVILAVAASSISALVLFVFVKKK